MRPRPLLPAINEEGYIAADLLVRRSAALDKLLELEQARPSWRADAACREHPEVTWFPVRGQSSVPAAQICEGCLSKQACLAWALAQPDQCLVSGPARRQGTTVMRRQAAWALDR